MLTVLRRSKKSRTVTAGLTKRNHLNFQDLDQLCLKPTVLIEYRSVLLFFFCWLTHSLQPFVMFKFRAHVLLECTTHLLPEVLCDPTTLTVDVLYGT